MSLKLCSVLLLIFTINQIQCLTKVEIRDYEKQTLDSLLDKSKYDTEIPPVGISANGTEGPTVVVANFYLRSIEYVCTKKQEWKTQITFRQQWNDKRLKYDDRNGQLKYLQVEDVSRLWRTDTFISNARSTQIHSDLKPNALVRIYPNGNVLYSTRITTTLSCPMDLKYYPFDVQICSITLASYGYTTDDVLYLWKEESPVQVTKNLHLKEFTMQRYLTTYCTSKTNTGEYSCMRVDFQFKRESSKYMCQWFAPTAILTFISFVSFWLRPDKSSRIKLLIITLVLLYLHIIYINNKSATTVSYSTAKDCWFKLCLGFILATFVEYGIIRIINKFNRNDKTDSDSNDYKSSKSLLKSEESDVEKQIKRNYIQKWRESSFASHLDLLSAIVFPLLFTAFIMYYFCSLLFRSDLQDF